MHVQAERALKEASRDFDPNKDPNIEVSHHHAKRA